MNFFSHRIVWNWTNLCGIYTKTSGLNLSDEELNWNVTWKRVNGVDTLAYEYKFNASILELQFQCPVVYNVVKESCYPGSKLKIPVSTI